MRDRTKLLSFALCALLMLGFASTVQAQIQHTVSSNPNEVVQYGNTELMGEFRLTWANTGISGVIGSTITITYQGVTITNADPVGAALNTPQAGGIEVTGSPAYTGVTATSIATTGGGGQVIISIPATVAPGANDFIAVNGVRADVSARSVNTDISAAISSSPSNANTFLNASVLRVATVNTALTITSSGVTRAICTTPAPGTGDPIITVTEGFAGVFVQYVASAAGTPIPANARFPYGATANTGVQIVVTGVPAGVVLAWPATVASTTVGGGTLELVTAPDSSIGATYEYTTADQGVSDGLQEVFDITVGTTVTVTSSVGTAKVHGRIYPATTSLSVPRFNQPFTSDEDLESINKCVTNILFPFVANVSGYDTGIAIANTSYDADAITPTTTPQSGPLTLYLYKSSAEPATAVPPATLTVPNVSAGNVWAGTMSTVPAFAGSTGYIIAVAQFQFAHGFCFISYGNANGLVLAQGYVGNIIPDVALTAGSRSASPAATANSGENLGQ
jgi:hypothetical protein